MTKINLREKLDTLAGPWTPTVIAELNGQYVKVVRFEGEYVWHAHAEEDEMFLVVRGRIRILFRDREVVVEEGELCVVPRGVDHKPVADAPADVVLFEPATTRSTGDVDHEYTLEPDELPRS